MVGVAKVVKKAVRILKKKSQKGKGKSGSAATKARVAKARAAKARAAKAKALAAARKERFSKYPEDGIHIETPEERKLIKEVIASKKKSMAHYRANRGRNSAGIWSGPGAVLGGGGLLAAGFASGGLPEAEAAAPYALKTIWYNAKTLAKAKADGMSPSLIARFKKQKRLHVVQPKKQGNLGMQEFTTGGFTGPTSGQYTGMPKGPQLGQYTLFDPSGDSVVIKSAKSSPKRTLQAKFSAHHRLITHKARAPETQWTPFYGPKKGVKIDLKGKDWLMQKMWTPISGPAEAARGVAPTKRGVDKKIVKGYYVNLTDAEKGQLSTVARAEQAYKTGRYKPKKADKPMSEVRAKKYKAAGIQTQYTPYTKTQGNVSAMSRHGVVKIKMPDGTVRFFGSHEAAVKAYNKALVE